MNEFELLTIDSQILLKHAFAMYWQAVATTKIAVEQTLFHSNGDEYSDNEKIQHAMNIAGNNVEQLKILVDRKKELVFKLLEEKKK